MQQSAGGADDMVARVALDLLMAGPDQLDGVIVRTLRTIGDREEADRVYITMFGADGTFANSHEWLADGITSHQSFVDDLATADFPWSMGLAARGEVLNIASIDDLPPEATAERYSFGLFGVRSVLQVPMFVDGALRGLIGVNHMRSSLRSSEDFVQTVGTIANAMAVALTRRDRERALAEARDAAVRAGFEKDSFLARVSHELRTPLHAIVGFTELLRFEVLGITAERSVERIDEASRNLLVLVDDLIELGSAQGTEPVGVSLSVGLKRALERRGGFAASRRVRLRTSAGLSNCRIRADDGLLARVLDAILTSAISNARPGGTVEIDGSVDGRYCALQVHDDGPAIDPRIIETALRSTTADAEWVTDGRGIGLGLVLARSIAERMHGTLQLGNHPEGGVVAELRLPLDAAPPSRSAR